MDKNTKQHSHSIHYLVNDEEQLTSEKTLTSVQIVKSAGIDSETSFLEQIVDHKKVSYKDKPNEPIEMENGMKFITVFIGPMTVSC